MSVACILIATSVAKLFSSTGTARLLDSPDDVLPLDLRQTLWLAAAAELAVAALLGFGQNLRVKLVWITWLSGNFAMYRIAKLLMGSGKPCPCLGSLTGRLHINQALAENVLMALIAYMLFGGIFFLISLRGERNGFGETFRSGESEATEPNAVPDAARS